MGSTSTRMDWVGPTPNFVAVPSPAGSLAYANHHVIATQVFEQSAFLKALEAAGLFTQNDFSQNGISLIQKVNTQYATHSAKCKCAKNSGQYPTRVPCNTWSNWECVRCSQIAV